MADENRSRAAADGYIAARMRDLAQALAADAGPDADNLNDVLKILSAILHYESLDELDALKALYDPLDPEAAERLRNTSEATFEAFERAFTAALERGNFVEIEADDVRTAEATKHLTGLKIKPSQAGIRRVRFFARGAHPEQIEVKTWFGLRTRTLAVDVMSDVIVLVGFKPESEIDKTDRKAFARMRRGVRPGAALVKHFRNVAGPELVTLHPGARPSMRPRDQVFLAAPALAAGVPVVLNLWPALTILFAVLAAYFGARGVIEESELKRALAAMSGLVAVGAFVMRQRLKYEAQTLRYQKQLADTVYFRNLANNAGVLDLLIGAGQEQDAKEALLAYTLLLRAETGMGKGELDLAAETFLRARLQLDLDFEIGDALAKLERLGLVSHDSGHYRALSTGDALARLDAAWDSYFNFSRVRG
ncbi:MAG: DUF3754 domain-containing protein [Hyphomonadaceae bacterium]